ncbi:MAG TPA: GNAT family N-acetyltransferase [Ktedonobacteraceae bacterium]
MSYGWITFDQEEIGEVSLHIRLQAGEAYIWNCATLPDYRGQRIYCALLVYMSWTLHQLGLHRIWIGTDNTNLPSQRSVARAGFQPVCDIFITHASPAQRVGIRGYPPALPQLVMDAQAALLNRRAKPEPHHGQPG